MRWSNPGPSMSTAGASIPDVLCACTSTQTWTDGPAVPAEAQSLICFCNCNYLSCAPSFLLQGEKKKKEKIESWLTHFLTFQGRVHVWELSWCPDCSGTLSPPDPNRPAGLQWVPSLGALQITPPPSPSSSTLPSYRIWDYEFHLNTGCSDRMQPCVIITWKL